MTARSNNRTLTPGAFADRTAFKTWPLDLPACATIYADRAYYADLFKDLLTKAAYRLVALPRSILHRCHNSLSPTCYCESAPAAMAYADGMRERRFAFVLRLWIEESDLNDVPILRGSLQAAESEQVRYFTSLADLTALLNDLIEPRDQSGADAPQARQRL